MTIVSVGTDLREYVIRHPAFDSGQVRDLCRDEGRFTRNWLAVSPDQAWILYDQFPAPTSELMLVENFR